LPVPPRPDRFTEYTPAGTTNVPGALNVLDELAALPDLINVFNGILYSH
jgi:hypothetical protein